MIAIAVALPTAGADPGELLADAGAYEAAGAHAVWIGEPVLTGASPGFDPWPFLGAMAAVTSRLRIGLTLAEPLSWPAPMLAAQRQAVDWLSRGRLLLAATTAELQATSGAGFLVGTAGAVVRVAAGVSCGALLLDPQPGEMSAICAEVGPEAEVWPVFGVPANRAQWRELREQLSAAGVAGVVIRHDPRLLDLIRNPDLEDDRQDTQLAQG